MTKFLLTPFVAFFLMLLWAATIGDQVAYFMPGKNMFDEYLIICQIWFFGCVFKSLKNSLTIERPKPMCQVTLDKIDGKQ